MQKIRPDMETLRFKTNINCGGCIKAVTPQLNKVQGIARWQVDTDNPEKILTVETQGADVATVKKAVEAAGFEAVPIV